MANILEREPPIRCWAASLGGCSEKISREHPVSKGLFPTDEIFVQGLSWCENVPKKVGIDSFTRKILCSKHNTELSVADDAAIDAANKFREAYRLLEIRGNISPRIWNRLEFRIDVHGLERWLLKTFIDFAFGGNRLIGGDATVPGEPPTRLVEVAFGHKSFNEKAGLYVIAHVGQNVPSDDRVRITTCSLREAPTRLTGARFQLRGFTYLLCLDEIGAPQGLTFIGKDGAEYAPSGVFYRRAHLNFEVHGRLSHVIHIDCD